MHSKRARSTAIAIAVALIAAIAVTACGSSATTGSKTSGASAASASTGRAKLAACLKQHGITLPSRPAGSKRPAGGGPPAGGDGGGQPPASGGGYGGGFFGGGPGGATSAQSSKFRAAFKACGADFGGGRFRRGGTAGGKPTAAALAKFTVCVAQHGYKLPNANTSGSGPVFPRSIESNKKFEAAAKACQSALRPSGGGSGSGSGSGSGGSGSGSGGSSGSAA